LQEWNKGRNMKKIKLVPKNCSSSEFEPYGIYISVDQKQPDYACPEFSFWNKLGIIESQKKCSVCIVESYPSNLSVATIFESHARTGETLIPVEDDILIVVGLSKSNSKNEMDFNSIMAFFIKKGTAVILKPGTWHYAPIVINTKVRTFVVFDNETPDTDVVKIDTKDANVAWEISL